jgi:hypothetical protein
VGAEIDLEIAAYDDAGKKAPTYQMQLPIWKPPTGTAKQAIRLLKSKAEKKGIELIERLYNTFFEDSGNPSAREWAYTYPGYNAREWVHYKLDWSPKSIDWYTQGVQRISFANNKDESFPHTPLVSCLAFAAVSRENDHLTTISYFNYIAIQDWSLGCLEEVAKRRWLGRCSSMGEESETCHEHQERRDYRLPRRQMISILTLTNQSSIIAYPNSVCLSASCLLLP